MPIYAYRCTSCRHAKDVLQKVSDPLLTECPACGAATFSKQLTAAGFQLKGSGWYVTDFRGGNNAAAKSEGEGTDKGEQGSKSEGADKPSDKSADGAKASEAGKAAAAPASATSAAPASSSAPAPAAASPAPSPAGS